MADLIPPHPMTVEVQGNPRDFVEAWHFSNRRTRMNRFIIILLAGIILVGTRFFVHEEMTSVFAWLGGWFIVLAFLMPLMTRNTLRKYYRTHALYDETKTYTLNNEGLTCDSYSHRTFIRWHAFSHWRETPRLFLIYFGASASYYIPKQSLGSEQRATELRELLQKTIGRTKYVPPVKAFPVSQTNAE